jgi:hypothetical protein
VTVNLVRDLLDQQLLDRNGRKIGRVDGILLELRPHRAPTVAAMETSISTLARRVHPRLESIVSRMARALGADGVRLPLTKLRDIGIDVEVDVDADRDPRMLRFEKWLSRSVIRKLPGGTS